MELSWLPESRKCRTWRKLRSPFLMVAVCASFVRTSSHISNLTRSLSLNPFPSSLSFLSRPSCSTSAQIRDNEGGKRWIVSVCSARGIRTGGNLFAVFVALSHPLLSLSLSSSSSPSSIAKRSEAWRERSRRRQCRGGGGGGGEEGHRDRTSLCGPPSCIVPAAASPPWTNQGGTNEG